jgi:hypothetical protein
VCGPSNVGNYFAAHQIAATCGFGVTYENLHALNECIKVDTIEMTHKVYYTAVRSRLTLTAAMQSAWRLLCLVKSGSRGCARVGDAQ